MRKEQVLINHIQEYIDSGKWEYEACYLNKTDLEVIIKALEQKLLLEKKCPTYECSSCPHSGSIIDGYVDCPDAYTKQSQYCRLNNKE